MKSVNKYNDLIDELRIVKYKNDRLGAIVFNHCSRNTLFGRVYEICDFKFKAMIPTRVESPSSELYTLHGPKDVFEFETLFYIRMGE